jgi:CheY-like chemotaxis protein
MHDGNLILIVEDNDADVELLRIALKKRGIGNPVCVHRDGASAMAYVCGEGQYSDRKEHPIPALVFLDLKLPNRAGFEILERLRKQPEFDQTLVAVISVSGEIDVIRRAYKLGATTFLTKPCCGEDLDNFIRAHPGYWLMEKSARVSAGHTSAAPREQVSAPGVPR